MRKNTLRKKVLGGIEVDLSKLSHSKQKHQPVMMAVRNRRHIHLHVCLCLSAPIVVRRARTKLNCTKCPTGTLKSVHNYRFYKEVKLSVHILNSSEGSHPKPCLLYPKHDEDETFVTGGVHFFPVLSSVKTLSPVYFLVFLSQRCVAERRVPIGTFHMRTFRVFWPVYSS